MKRLEATGTGNAPLYAERTNTLARLIAGKPAPAKLEQDVDIPRFLQETGFNVRRLFKEHDDAALRESINRHLLRMELGYAAALRYTPGDGCAKPHLTFDRGSYIPPFDRRIQARVATLLPRVYDMDAQREEEDAVADLFSRIVEHQDPASMLMPSLRTFLHSMDYHTAGLVVNAMQLVMMGKGLDVGTVDIAPTDRELLLPRLLQVARADGGGTAEASAYWLLMKLNEFIKTASPSERGVKPGSETYAGVSKLIAAAVTQPAAAQALLKGALHMAAPALFDNEHGAWVRELAPDIIDLALSNANTAYLRMLVHNRQPLFLKTQYLSDVTTTVPAWKRTVRTPAGEEFTYAAIHGALTRLFASESNRRYRHGVATTLARLGMKIQAVDPAGALEDLPTRFIAVSNHQSYVDIGALATLLVDRFHRFVAHDGLPAITLGIGSFLIGSHLLIERIPRTMHRDRKSFVRKHTIAAYGETLKRAALFIFPQGTRSRLSSSWRDRKIAGDGQLAGKYHGSATVLAELAVEHGVPILPVHFANTGNAFMYLKEGLGDILGARQPWRARLNNLNVPVFGTKYVRRIRADVHPLIDPFGRTPDDIVEELISFHNERDRADIKRRTEAET